MLELHDVSVTADGQPLIRGISAAFPDTHFGAIIGPSGCGKTSLLRAIAGLIQTSGGNILWQGRDLEQQDLAPSELGYVPQFSIAHARLTVAENLRSAARLRVRGLGHRARADRIHQILQSIGIEDVAHRQVRLLSGGQQRRLGLAMELVSDPRLLLCDEVTSGLDPKSENDLVHLMRRLALDSGRLVLSVTHSLRHIDAHDSVTLLHGGRLVFHGPPGLLLHYFEVAHAEDVYPKLADREPEAWHELWLENAPAFAGEALSPRPAPPHGDGDADDTHPEETRLAHPPPAAPTPGPLPQFFELLTRRCRLFLRSPGEIWLQILLTLGFPCIVVLFAYKGLPQIQNLNMGIDVDILEQLRQTIDFTLQTCQIGSLVSGLVMFQVVLLTLMGSNNAAREIVAERLIFEKEKLSGLRPAAHVAAKSAFLLALVAAQSAWMCIFVKFICGFPGDLASQFANLCLANGAMTAVCLAISAWSRTSGQASLISMYLVGFQLPLSGAILSLPEALGAIVRPFIASYWSWSGYLQTMKDTRLYDLAVAIAGTPLSPGPLCLWTLACHVAIGIFLAYTGCLRAQWRTD
ncbi:MAG: ATP-binding cassette domain-containing protein [Verrucomicrobiae bacterium]|nr:ATP-binding cassette domain-containing protein [Verrucomicrobiae bacterium]